jgi:hypothetical protein
MAEEKTRVNFNAPEPLVRQADVVADLLDVSRTRLLVEALQDEIEDITSDEQFQRQLREAYYDGRVDVATVRSILGSEEAMRVRRLRNELDREPPEPHTEDGVPSAAEFYAEPPAEWTPEDADDA